ncbi:hypothetical protein I553_0207 [Mycobacterium xenopi 4042]|uniref:Uncharacterized protein n=1 Tax=Mycobacterium xenopi 4042 TaxID=1299334 RepID=X7YKJ1_MYCXE|nr:hypothetical protein I553_0207 [Mycobacterium xenopi 4042]EUA19492.1 hypothetical protein I552_9235 [Mycobacterium xenopi 3993]
MLPSCPSSTTSRRRATSSTVGRPRRPRCDVPARGPASSSRTSPDTGHLTGLRTAADFADAALRRVLEVIDRRRPAAQLRPLLAAGLADSVLARGPGATSRHGAAVLRRLRLQAAGLHNPPRAAEVFGTYSRATGYTPSPAGWNDWLVLMTTSGRWSRCISVDWQAIST